MTDIVALIVVLAIVGGAVLYIVRAKRRGAKCIGCSVGESACCEASAQANAQGGCGCGCGSVDQMVSNMENSVK